MEKNLRDLQEELRTAKKEFAALFHVVHVDTSFDHPFESGGLSDGYSEGVDYPKLNYETNPKEAVYLWSRIEALKAQISSFSQEQEREARISLQREKENDVWRKSLILGVAKDLYKKYLVEYKKSSVFEKASIFLSGNSPILDTDEEILEVYGKVAVDSILAPALAEIKRVWEKQLEGVKKDFTGKELDSAIRQTNDYFGSKCSSLNVSYGISLEELLTSLKEKNKRR